MSNDKQGTVYLIHFDKKFHHAQHYIGYTDINVLDRIARHLQGHGSRLLRAVTNAGIKIKLVRTWTGNKTLERKLKNQKNAKRLCPICKGKEQ